MTVLPRVVVYKSPKRTGFKFAFGGTGAFGFIR